MNPYAKKNSPIPVMIFDPCAFDCCICFQPLSIPVSQCDNGHIVCSICSPKLKNKCDKCLLPISSKCCEVIENLLKSIKMPCPNEKYGCRETISYGVKRNHEEDCINAQCHCPFSSCDYVASSELLANHLNHKHEDSRIKFSYGCSFVVSLKPDDEAIVLQEKCNGKLFILNNSTTLQGNAVNISFIGTNSYESKYNYDILVRSQISSAKFQSSPRNFRQRTSATLSSVFLSIPFGYFGYTEPLKLEICITVKIKIFVKTTTGNVISMEVENSDTIAKVKAKVQDIEWFLLHKQCLVFANKKLDDRRTITDYNIIEKSNLRLVSVSE